MTEKLFDKDSYIKDFTAIVLKCEKCEGGYKTELDRTAFFPEGGGQKGDTGTLGGIAVFDTQESGGTVFHYTKEPLKENTAVRGEIEWFPRYCKMQNHTAEHIVSGTVHSRFGYDNVGFHLGENFFTMDFNGTFSEKEIRLIERTANEISVKNLAVRAWYPEDISALTYRSKLDLTENVRIVEIDGVDRCACCAPHVRTTGETGLIKIISAEKNKGGTRLFAKSGFFALDEFNMYQDNIRKISAAVSLPVNETAAGVCRLKERIAELEYELRNRCLENVLMLIESGNERCAFVDSPDMLKDCANALFAKYGGTVGAFSGNDESGYRYMMLTDAPLAQLKEKAEKILCARGGGRDSMLQGSARTTKKAIKDFFEKK